MRWHQAAEASQRRCSGMIGHGLPPQAFVDMVAWLAEQIGINKTKFKVSS
jgi:hypothetical protein